MAGSSLRVDSARAAQQPPHLVAGGHERVEERAADQAARPGDDDAHGALRQAFFSAMLESTFSRSIGIGKIVVELFSVAISASVCR